MPPPCPPGPPPCRGISAEYARTRGRPGCVKPPREEGASELLLAVPDPREEAQDLRRRAPAVGALAVRPVGLRVVASPSTPSSTHRLRPCGRWNGAPGGSL